MGSGLLEGLEPADGVVEVGPAVEKVLGAAGQQEIEGLGLGRFGGGADPLDGQREVVDGLFRIPGGVFDRGTGEASPGSQADRLGGRFRGIAEAFDRFGAALTTGDFNKDGKTDLVVGPHWYEGPEFETRPAGKFRSAVRPSIHILATTWRARSD